MFQKIFATIAIIAALTALAVAQAKERSRDGLVQLVVAIQRADYEGDRVALKRLHDQLEPFLGNKELVSRVEYWRGFTLWRRAFNGFNESVDPHELQADLEQALNDFDASSSADPKFVDAKIGAGSCLSNLMFLNRGDPTRIKELIAQANDVLKQAKTEAPDNPRLYWVLGPNVWYAPPERGGSQSAAIELYKKGLDLIDNGKPRSSDPLEPSWGEPELLMNLAWSNLHKSTPDPAAAQSYARSALKLVPYWHYVRDLLLPQINQAVDSGVGAPAPESEGHVRAGDHQVL
jgi:hypothetical protein